MKQFFVSIRFRMLAIYLFITLIALLAIIVTVTRITEDFLVKSRVEKSTTDIGRFAFEMAPLVKRGDPDMLYELVFEKAQVIGGRVLFLDTNAVVQVDSASLYNGYVLDYREVRSVLLGQSEVAYSFHDVYTDNGANQKTDLWTMYYTSAVTLNGERIGAIFYSVPIQDIIMGTEDVISKITLMFVIITLLITVITLLLSQWFSKPISDLTAAVRKMGVKGHGVRVSVVGRSEVAELATAINRMSDRVDAYDRVRDEFIANASHELKTPLATMKLLSENMIYEENVDPSVMKDFFKDVTHEVDRLSKIVNSLLSLVLVDAGESELHPQYFDFSDMVRDVTNRLQPLAKNKDLILNTDISHVCIMADKDKIEQVVVNLTENAIKYTDTGSVTVRLYPEGENAVFSVTDTGVGIGAEDQKRIFDRFYRVDKTRSRATGGTGLGLSIVESIVTRHGGTIGITSEKDVGSTFTVRLKLAEQPKKD
ncbi:MAG: HAMP domain-containing sensor histidine kinase [Clostridia bacterium]